MLAAIAKMSVGMSVGPNAVTGGNWQTQKQVDKVADTMRASMEKVLESYQSSHLDDQSNALQTGSCHFEISAAKLEKSYW